MSMLAVVAVGILKSKRQRANDLAQAGPSIDEKGKTRQSGDALLDRDLAVVEEDRNDPSIQPADEEEERSQLTWMSVATTPVKASRMAFRRGKDFVFQTGPYADDTAGLVIPQYRWLPIFAGLTIPLAVMLEIPGLTEHWYVRQENGQAVEYQSNPLILNVGLGFSLASGVLANICIILRFLEKRVRLFTVIAICMLIVHDIINIVAVTIFGVIHRNNDGFDYSQAFWLTLCSTIASFFVTFALIWDLWRTEKFATSGSGLTRKQRSLIIIWMILLSYISIGALCWTSLMGLSFADALYFTVVSIETVGFGDIHPTGVPAQIFSIFYNTFGILNVGLFIATARATIIEAFEHAYRRRRHEISLRRHDHRQRRADGRARRIAIERQLREAGLPLYVPQRAGRSTRMKLNKDALDDMQRKRAEEVALDIQSGEKHHDDVEVPLYVTTAEQTGATRETKGRTLALAKELQNELTTAGLAEEDQYKAFREKISKEERQEFAAKLLISCTLFIVFWGTGIGIFMATEGFIFVDALYFCYTTFTTVVVTSFLATRFIRHFTPFSSPVLSEAFESNYSSALHNSVFENAVKNFNSRKSDPDEQGDPEEPDTYDDERDRAREALEKLPGELLLLARTFHEHMSYFQGFGSQAGSHIAPPPRQVTDLLDEIAQSDRMDPRLKKEILMDDESKKTLFLMSYEQSLRKMISTAERAVMLMEQRDNSNRHKLETGPLTPLSDASTASYDKWVSPNDQETLPSADASSSSRTPTSGFKLGSSSKMDRAKEKIKEKREEGEKILEMEEERVERKGQDRQDEKCRAPRRTETEASVRDDGT